MRIETNLLFNIYKGNYFKYMLNITFKRNLQSKIVVTEKKTKIKIKNVIVNPIIDSLPLLKY